MQPLDVPESRPALVDPVRTLPQTSRTPPSVRFQPVTMETYTSTTRINLHFKLQHIYTQRKYVHTQKHTLKMIYSRCWANLLDFHWLYTYGTRRTFLFVNHGRWVVFECKEMVNKQVDKYGWDKEVDTLWNRVLIVELEMYKPVRFRYYFRKI